MRLIDADKIEKFIEDGLNCKDYRKRFGHDAIEIMTEIHFSETVDAASVVHGRWIRYPDCGVTRCSNCDWSIEECFDSRYCPNCGAKMDLPEDSE